jgi:hypothetical protein
LLLVLPCCFSRSGDRELSAADIILGELHLGATYDAVSPQPVMAAHAVGSDRRPLCILAATYALMYGGYEIWVIDRGPVLRCLASRPPESRDRALLSRPARAARYRRRTAGCSNPRIYLPMLAGVAYFTSTVADTRRRRVCRLVAR